MVLDQLVTNYNDLSNGEFILVQRHFADKLERHPVFSVLPEHVPGPAKHREYADQLTKEYETQKSGKLPTRQEAQEAIQVTAAHICMYAWYRKDPSLLDDVGLERKERAYTKQSDAVPAPPEKPVFKVEDDGTVTVVIHGLPRKGTAELWINERNPADESAWAMFTTLYTARSQVKGVARVKELWFRTRFCTAAGASGWSQVTRFVLV